MKVVITLTNGKEHDLPLGASDADEWMRRFGAMGTSALGDWVEVVPEEGVCRTFVRASQVVTVQLIDDREESFRSTQSGHNPGMDDPNTTAPGPGVPDPTPEPPSPDLSPEPILDPEPPDVQPSPDPQVPPDPRPPDLPPEDPRPPSDNEP
jgi:hypothetical protein